MQVSDRLRKWHSYFSLICCIYSLGTPGAPANLTLIDLPGLIATTESGSSQEVQLVRQVTEQYISRDNAIIVAVISCETDADNQPIYNLAKARDPRGRRTLGVLTKPDLIQEQCHGKWLEIVK